MTTITAPAVNPQCTPAERITRSLLGYGIIAGPMYVLISRAGFAAVASSGGSEAANLAFTAVVIMVCGWITAVSIDRYRR
jgi:hypothetical protein